MEPNMPMPFFDDHRAESRTQTLIGHMMALSKAVTKGDITVEELQTISKQSTTSLASKWEGLVKDTLDTSASPNSLLKKLYDILKKAPTISIKDATPLVEGLKRFDSEHGDYLSLTPLTIQDDQTLALSLGDYATFYNVFIKHMTYKMERGELGDQYVINFDTLAARNDWLRWQSTRPTYVRFDPLKSEHPALFEKFLAGQLKRNEWLSDLDIRRELTHLGLDQLVHVVPFKEDDIGLTLHFERQKHELDEPKKTYVIPLIVNLGEDGHSHIDSRGVHWTRILITVDPSNVPPTITADYNDELFLHESSKREIRKVLNDAIKYRTELGGYSKDEEYRVYQAFPDCDNPTINIEGSGEQRDGFTCGYRSLKGILNELIQKGVIKIEDKEDYQELMDCTDVTSLRNFVYRSLIGDQHISNETKEVLQQLVPENVFKDSSESEQFVVNSTLVEGQLLAFSYPTVKKEGKKGKLSIEQLKELEQLVEQNKKFETLRELEVIKNIATSVDEHLELNIQKILENVAEKDPKLVLQVVFEQVRKNKDLKTLKLAGADTIEPQLLHEKIDSLPLRIQLSSEIVNLAKYLEIINARNELLESKGVNVTEGSDPWDFLFEKILFTPSDFPSGTRLEWMNHSVITETKAIITLGASGFSKLLHYIAAHEDRFVDDFLFKEFDMTRVNPEHVISINDTGLAFMQALREHLHSDEPFIPFKQFNFYIQNLATVNLETLINELTDILEAASGLEKLEINTNTLAEFPEKTIENLIAHIKEKKCGTVLSFTAPKDSISSTLQAKLQELENAALFNRRQGLTVTVSPSAQSAKAKTKEPVVLGKIGKAILKTEGLEGLDTEVQIQEQQQQQVQQQIQTALDNEELPEEDEIEEEPFLPFTDNEELLTKKTISKLNLFIKSRHPHLTSERCWDLITGANADLFKYGIKKITISAAKVLIENLQDVQYGLHPDNLPQGFSLQQDKAGDVVLAYTSLNPAINPNESPLTIRFSKPMPPNQWFGNTLQFMTKEQAQSFYDSVIKPMKSRPTLEDCISQFFFLKSDVYTVGNKTIPLSDSQRAKILNGFIDVMASKEEAIAIQKKIKGIFGDKPSAANIKALSEVFYEQGLKGLSDLLDNLSDIKKIKEDKFFASFKTCFIDSSQNLNELTTENAKLAMQKLLTLSSAQTAWWVSLTEQHTSNLCYQPGTSTGDFTVVQSPGKRWANLSELTEGFLHFCSQLDEISSGLGLTESCPLTEVADMRVALDRLLTTILPNALDVDEQFYQGLHGLPLDPLGPFYASRYEGYKLVHPEMMLDLDKSYSNNNKPESRAKDNKKFALHDFCFRCDKKLIGANLSASTTDQQKKSQFMRYIATYNQRAPLHEYLGAFEQLSKVSSDVNPVRIDNLLILIAIYGSGKRGKHFTQEDIKRLVEWDDQFKPESPKFWEINVITSAWRSLRTIPIRPNITEIIDISDMALHHTYEPKQFITNVREVIQKYGSRPESEESAERCIEALLILGKNKQSLDPSNFINIVKQVEGLNSEFTHVKNVKAEYELSPQIMSATMKLLAVCNSKDVEKDVEEAAVIAMAKALYAQVEKCFLTHGSQTTSDLLELLGNIDVEKSTDLPSLKELTVLVKDIADNPKPDYLVLEQTVKSKLSPTCVIQMEKVTATPVEPAGNLHMIITKYMGEIRSELSPYKTQIGEEFYDQLATPKGTKILLDSLDQISKMSGFMGGVVQGKIKGVMLKVYESVTKNGLAGIGIKDELTNNRLDKVFNYKINHQIKKEDNFVKFCNLYGGELQFLNQFLGNLQNINKNWPADLRNLLDILDTSSNLNSYPLSLLAHITNAFVNNFDKNVPFPNDLIRKFLAFKDVTPDILGALRGIVDEVLDPEKTSFLKNNEKISLCEIALSYCQTNYDPKTAQDYIKKVLSSSTSDGDLFAARLKLLSNAKKVDAEALTEVDEALAVLKKMNNPELSAKTYAFFTEEESREKDLRPVLAELGKIDNLTKRSLVLAIALKAAQQKLETYNVKLLTKVITNLNKLDQEVLKQLDALYHSPKHPELSSLNDLLIDPQPLNKEALETLQADYDRDYWLKTKNADRNFYGCDLFLMSPDINSKKSDKNHLYLFKDNERFYYKTKDNKTNYLDDEAIKKALNGKKFNQAGDKLLACSIHEVCSLVLNKTSKRGHTNFISSQLAKYLNNLQDMNYERSLLLSQREELQKWFLYINAIGNNRGIPTQPWTTDEGASKPVKKMSHEEIQGLLKHYRTQLKDKELPGGEQTKVRLETIALLREAMYRGTGKFPRPTQILYLLTAMQSGENFIAQIQTGQGKSMTASLAAAMSNMEGKTVDICTSSLFLASEGLEENHSFFEYLGMKAKLIHANSGKDDYEAGAIHYSSMSELALHRSKMQLFGKVFPPSAECTLIADEVDFSTLDDSTRYRYATSLDPVTDPYKSPYIWVYESLLQFVDTQKAPKSDEEFMAQAKSWLRNAAKTKEEKSQLRNLEEHPEVYKKRLETWLVAAGKTNQLIEMEQIRYRVVALEHKKYGSVSKACILTNGRPSIQAEFSDAIQQFLHVQLRKKYRSEIDAGKMPDFLVEPEKTYVTTLNSKILLNTYKERKGMSGTAGSRVEIKEQYGKYGFRFVDIPPFAESERDDLPPILTNPKYIEDLKKESSDHIKLIVKETLHYLSRQKAGKAGPILLHCADKEEGEKVHTALQKAIRQNSQYQSKLQVDGIQSFYSSEKTTAEARNKEEQEIKEKAGKDGMITISTVFGRGTDIKPTHDNGLYTIDTFVDTDPHSSEDLERSKQQKIGRSGRAGQHGFTRLIVRRREFSDIYKTAQMRKIPETIEGLDQAISELNRARNAKRVIERETRESFDDVKDIIYQEFFKYIQVINSTNENVPKKAIRDKLAKQWNLVLSRIDNHWDKLQHDPQLKGDMVRQLDAIALFACDQWKELAEDNGVLRTDLNAWAEYNNLQITLPEINPIDVQDTVEAIKARKPHLERFYVKRSQEYGKVDPSVSEAAVYSDFISSSKSSIMKNGLVEPRAEAIQSYITHKIEWLSTPAHRQKLRDKFTITAEDFTKNNVKEIMGALLYLRYKAYTNGNPVAYACLSRECRRFEEQMKWSNDSDLIDAVVQAQQDHFNALTHHRGEHETQKGKYLSTIMLERRRLLPEQTSKWKKECFTTWWYGNAEALGINTQAVNWLTDYKDKWWTRGWVSKDRKVVVESLLAKLQTKNNDPKQILEYIADARKELLRQDFLHSRSLKSGVQGRLYQYLNELELKVQAAMTPEELDENADNMLNNITYFLNLVKNLGINTEQFNVESTQEKYQALLMFFNNVPLMGKLKKANSDNWVTFQAYCQQTKLEMVRYFAQCDEKSKFNEQRSVQVYQAVSEAATAHFQRVMDWDVKPKLNLPKGTFTYRDKNINFTVDDNFSKNKKTNSPLFMKVNQADTYRELLYSIERSIVENSLGDTQVQFQTITLNRSERFLDEGFKLSVSMIIDGVPATIDYQINMETGEMYCNHESLQLLDKSRREPELPELTIEKKVIDSQQKWYETSNSGTKLTKETREMCEPYLRERTKEFRQEILNKKLTEEQTSNFTNKK